MGPRSVLVSRLQQRPSATPAGFPGTSEFLHGGVRVISSLCVCVRVPFVYKPSRKSGWKVPCAPKWFGFEYTIIKTTNLLVETCSGTWAKRIYLWRLISSCRAPFTLTEKNSSFYSVFDCLWLPLVLVLCFRSRPVYMSACVFALKVPCSY